MTGMQTNPMGDRLLMTTDSGPWKSVLEAVGRGRRKSEENMAEREGRRKQAEAERAKRQGPRPKALWIAEEGDWDINK